MALLTYAQVSKFSDVREFFSAHKYKVLVLYYTCAKFLSSPNQKINGVGQQGAMGNRVRNSPLGIGIGPQAAIF